MPRNSRIAAVAALALAACAPRVDPGADQLSSTQQDVQVSHVFDLASHMPQHLAVMFSMSWFGIPRSDPQGAGPDPSYGNSQWGGGCVPTDNPASCNTCILYGASDACLQTGAPQRDVASRRRMLAGPYSASALDTEGQRRVDLMLSNLRRPCDDGAKLDAWTVQLNGTWDTALHPQNHQGVTANLAYHATVAFLQQADSAGMKNVIIPGDDATFYFHFGKDLGLGACDDSPNNPKQNCINALTQDFVDMANLAAAHPSGVRLNGKAVLFVYLDPQYLSPSQWGSILQNARNQSGKDFYMVGALQNPTAATYFQTFDALAPWVQLDWGNSSGSTVRRHAENYAQGQHQSLYSALPGYPGRVVFGGVAPGFDDWTRSWGQCQERQLPPGDPRDPQFLDGQFDYLATKGTQGIILETWDDWTEGSEFEPDVQGGTSVLVSLRDNLGRLYGEQSDPTGDQRLSSRWTSYGQARNCAGGQAGTPPLLDLTCSGGADGGTDGGYMGSCNAQVSNNVVGGWNDANVELLMDVNGDKKDDLVVIWNNTSAFAQVSLSNGSGFAQSFNGTIGAWDPTARNLPADVNGDGKKDLVRVYANGSSAYAEVLQSNGAGFTSVSNAPVGGWDLTYLDLMMDVNGDGKDDLVILWNNGQTTAQVTLSNGTSFTRSSNASLGITWNPSDQFWSADVNGDGKKDLVRLYAVGTQAWVQVFLSNGNGFASASNAAVGGWSPSWVDLVGDVNGDGKDDFVILWNNAGQVTAQVNVSNGAGFTQVSNASTGVAWNAANRAFLADVSGDRSKDLVIVYPSGASQAVQVSTSNGTGFAQSASGVLGGYRSDWVDLIGDVDGDGKADLAVLWQDQSKPAGQDARAEVNLSICR